MARPLNYGMTLLGTEALERWPWTVLRSMNSDGALESSEVLERGEKGGEIFGGQ